MKYNIGDKVRVIDCDGGVIHGFKIGEIVEVLKTDCGDKDCFCRDSRGKEDFICWVDIEPIKQIEDWRIEIVPNGDKTTATLYKAGKEIKSATVKRYKEDKYSISAATEYAVKKLFEKKQKKKKRV